MMKVGRGVEPGVLVLLKDRSVAPGARSLPGHVVDDRVDIDVHARCGATGHHAGKLGAGTAAALLEPVSDGLVSLPPRKPHQDGVLAGRRNLHRGKSFWPE